MSRNRPKPLDIVAKNLVDRLWDDDVCDRKALTIVRSVLGQVAAEAGREAVRKDRLASTRISASDLAELRGLVESVDTGMSSLESSIALHRVIPALRRVVGGAHD